MGDKQNPSQVATFVQGIKTIFSTIVKWLIGIGIVAFIVWWLLPDSWRIKYASEYMIDSHQVVIDHKPYDCDWDSAPLGSKHCHYAAIVTVYNPYGHVIEGPGLDRANPPSDQSPSKVHVEWQRIEE
jgi:hypothetical protein